MIHLPPATPLGRLLACLTANTLRDTWQQLTPTERAELRYSEPLARHAWWLIHKDREL